MKLLTKKGQACQRIPHTLPTPPRGSAPDAAPRTARVSFHRPQLPSGSPTSPQGHQPLCYPVTPRISLKNRRTPSYALGVPSSQNLTPRLAHSLATPGAALPTHDEQKRSHRPGGGALLASPAWLHLRQTGRITTSGPRVPYLDAGTGSGARMLEGGQSSLWDSLQTGSQG